MRPTIITRTLFILLSIISLFIGSHTFAAGVTELVSVDSAGNQADAHSYNSSASYDGRFVAFRSSASNLVANDTNNADDIFVHDRLTGKTQRVSVDSKGKEANGSSDSPHISDNGRFVVFQSIASNLVANDTGMVSDIFVHDRWTHRTKRVSVDSSGIPANDFCEHPSISANGRFVAFDSLASNLVAGDTNEARDVFVHDRVTGVTERVSVDSAGNQTNTGSFNDSIRPSLSADGRYVAFDSLADTLVENDTNRQINDILAPQGRDIFVHDRTTGITERVSVDSNGNEANGDSGNPSISANGRIVAFESQADNLVVGGAIHQTDIFAHDRATGITELIGDDSVRTGDFSFVTHADLSANGRYVVFEGNVESFVRVFLHDRATGITERVNADSTDHSYSAYPSLSANGLVVTFASDSPNLVAGDTNEQGDVFAYIRSGLVNSKVRFFAIRNTFKTSRDSNGCPDGFFGKFQFVSKLSNKSRNTLSNLAIGIHNISNGNLLLINDQLLKKGDRFDVPKLGDYGDGRLMPREMLRVPFTVCLRNRNAFSLSVDVYGVSQ